jgi:hypothetical protein
MPSRLWLVASLAAASLAGCGDSAPAQLAKATKSVQDAVEQVQQTAAQATGISEGSIELTLDAPLKTDKCFARFTPKSVARPAVLQLRSYADETSEEFPSVLLWATGDAASAIDLVGQTIEGHLFIQRDTVRGIWSSPTLTPIKITVVQADLLSVTCEFTEADMLQADGDGAVKASGKLVALWEAGAK